MIMCTSDDYTSVLHVLWQTYQHIHSMYVHAVVVQEHAVVVQEHAVYLYLFFLFHVLISLFVMNSLHLLTSSQHCLLILFIFDWI